MLEEGRRSFIRNLTAAAACAVPAAAMAQTSGSASAQSATSVFNIVSYGAKGDGKTMNTEAIQRTIDACASGGGGMVLVPTGRFVTGPLFLKSHVQLVMLAGGVLAFTQELDKVAAIEGRWEGIDRTIYASLINGKDLENVSITGEGTLDGQGQPWWEAFRHDKELRRKLGLEEREPENPAGSKLKWGRPRMINLYDCKNVVIRGLHIQNSPSWNIHPVRCEHVLVDGVTITAPGDSPNTDGIDPDSCKDVRIANCYISVGDDCVIIKSGYRFNPKGVPCENITVTNCVFGLGHCGVGVGSETAGGVKNVVVSNCVCDGTNTGLRFKTARGRGRSVENVRASNFVMRNVAEPIVVTMFYVGGDLHEAKPVDERTPRFRNIYLNDVYATGAKLAARIEGLPEMPIENLSLGDVVVEDARDGIACTNVDGATFRNVRVETTRGPALNVHTARNLEVNGFCTRNAKDLGAAIGFTKVENAAVQSSHSAHSELLALYGQENRGIALYTNRVASSREVKFADGANESAIVKRT
jgi:hypothetical protein